MMSRYHDTMTRTAGNVLELGAAIRDARKRRGWTQAELADKAGVSRQLLTEVERGKRPGAEARGARASPMPRARATAMIPETSAPSAWGSPWLPWPPRPLSGPSTRRL